ncbi:MAG TPA: alkaline phosphatase family protein [Candidatus Angelobacter sp.]
MIVIEENKGFQQIMDTEDAVYLQSLIKQGASLTNMHAFHHPSQANYYELFSGSSQGIKGDGCPKERLAALSLGGLLNAKSNGDTKLSFAGYAENRPSEEDLKLPFKKFCDKFHHGSTLFAVKHTPWLGFKDSFALTFDSSEFDKLFSDNQDSPKADELPTVAMVIPNLISDMHNKIPDDHAAILAGSEWLEKHLKSYVAWAQTHNSLLIVTWDEDQHHGFLWRPVATKPPKNRIPTIFVGPMVKPCYKSDKQYTHHDLLRTIEAMYSLQPIGASASASVIDDIWKTDIAADGSFPCPPNAGAAPAKGKKDKDKHKSKPSASN